MKSIITYTDDGAIKILIETLIPHNLFSLPQKLTFFNNHNNGILNIVKFDLNIIEAGGSIAGEFLNQNAVNGIYFTQINVIKKKHIGRVLIYEVDGFRFSQPKKAFYDIESFSPNMKRFKK